MNHLSEQGAEGESATYLLYLFPDPRDLHQSQNSIERPLNALSERELCPGSEALEKLNASLRYGARCC